MLTRISRLFARPDFELDGNKPRDPYLDVLKEIQAPSQVPRRPLLGVLRQARGAIARTRPWRSGRG
jgi:hypothetical protein